MCRFIAKYIVDSQMSSAKENATPDKPVVGPRFELGRHFCSLNLFFLCVCVCDSCSLKVSGNQKADASVQSNFK